MQTDAGDTLAFLCWCRFGLDGRKGRYLSGREPHLQSLPSLRLRLNILRLDVVNSAPTESLDRDGEVVLPFPACQGLAISRCIRKIDAKNILCIEVCSKRFAARKLAQDTGQLAHFSRGTVRKVRGLRLGNGKLIGSIVSKKIETQEFSSC